MGGRPRLLPLSTSIACSCQMANVASLRNGLPAGAFHNAHPVHEMQTPIGDEVRLGCTTCTLPP